MYWWSRLLLRDGNLHTASTACLFRHCALINLSHWSNPQPRLGKVCVQVHITNASMTHQFISQASMPIGRPAQAVGRANCISQVECMTLCFEDLIQPSYSQTFPRIQVPIMSLQRLNKFCAKSGSQRVYHASCLRHALPANPLRLAEPAELRILQD